MTKQEAVQEFKNDVYPHIKERQDRARDLWAEYREAWYSFVNRLCKEGRITIWQDYNWTHPKVCR